MCGIVGIFGLEDASRAAFTALQFLQHRGQQGCGIAAYTPEGGIQVRKGAGLVRDVFSEADLAALSCRCCIGHVRYPTTDVGGRENIQPFRVRSASGVLALAHNGNIVNAGVVKSRLESSGHLFHSTSDSELFAHLVGMGKGRMEQNIIAAAGLLDGAFSTVILSGGALYACRDKYGFHPLCVGKRDGGYVVASETCALDALNASFLRDIEPGELVRIDRDGLTGIRHSARRTPCLCAMEYIYFARPDSDIDGCGVHAFRKETGRLLYKEHPAPADMVICVPESSISAAMGYAEAGGIPLETGLVKNAYVARTFIQPAQEMRDIGVKMKLSPIRSILKGKRVAVVDDSIVRGTTSRQIVRMLKEAGAREVHLRIASPRYAWPCFYGIDTGTRGQLIASGHSDEEICAYIGANSLAYLSVEALFKASGRSGLCTACFSGEYPTELYGCGVSPALESI